MIAIYMTPTLEHIHSSYCTTIRRRAVRKSLSHCPVVCYKIDRILHYFFSCSPQKQWVSKIPGSFVAFVSLMIQPNALCFDRSLFYQSCQHQAHHDRHSPNESVPVMDVVKFIILREKTSGFIDVPVQEQILGTRSTLPTRTETRIEHDKDLRSADSARMWLSRTHQSWMFSCCDSSRHSELSYHSWGHVQYPFEHVMPRVQQSMSIDREETAIRDYPCVSKSMYLFLLCSKGCKKRSAELIDVLCD